MDLHKLTILHSNDFHGDFFQEDKDHALVGGVSMLSGYIKSVRKEKENVIYAIAGDMLQGSIIDNEYKGISTIDIINLLKPDITTLGNHEIDYGLAHLLFLEKCARFPIINANLYIKVTGTRLFESHKIIEIGGMRVLFIGIVTNEVIDNAMDNLLATFVDIDEAANAIEYIINSYKTIDIDLTVILTHIGHDMDKELAAILKPELGVDLILGGHTHTFLEKPDEVNGILIAQAGEGSDFIGQFDLVIDKDTNSIHDYEWNLVPIDSTHCTRDRELDRALDTYSELVEGKYNRVMRRLDRTYYHEDRFRETELGNMIADIFWLSLGVDVYILGSGSIRGEKLGEIVTLKELREVYPYESKVYGIWIDGARLKQMIETFFNNFMDGNTREFYQFSRHIHIDYDKTQRKITKFIFNKQPLRDERVYSVGIGEFHFQLLEPIFGITKEELNKYKPPKVLSLNSRDVVDEFFYSEIPISAQVEDRIRIL